MKKSKFIKSTIILIIGGFITKILGMAIKIVTTRLIGTEGIGIYMLILPTFMLLIALAQLGFPVAISKLVSEDSKNNKKLVFSVIPISLIINILIIIFLFITAGYISTSLLHEPRSYFALLCIGFVLPFISISSILRGYFFGKQRMIPHVVSNITEDIVRLFIIIVGIPIFLNQGLEFAVAFVVLANIFSELTSIIILFFFLPKKFSIKKSDLKPDRHDIKEVMDISLPTTGSRIIGNIGYFLEPIILSFVLLSIGYSNSFLVNEYGILNGYVMPLLTLPAFFTLAISQALIPVVSNNYVRGNNIYVKNKVKQAIVLSLVIGIPITILFMINPTLPLELIYNTNEGSNYLVVLAPIFLLYYIQAPLTGAMQAMGKAKEAMKATLFGMIGRTLLLFSVSYLHVGMWGLVIATSFNVIFVTLYQYKNVKKVLKN